jgi:exopolyphosphatase/guanosine-5'-triphosphate,3'-diphosphate pyrophosphatase
MRIGVLDVGSNSAHLKIADLRPGEPPRPVTSVKHRTRLAESISSAQKIEEVAIERLVSVIGKAARVAEAEYVDELIAFATSAVRDAANREAITTRVAVETGIRLGFLDGRDEARLTFLAARAWYGWSAGPMLLFDIGGGSLEIAYGDGREPEISLSLPLGAGRLTREHLPGDPPRNEDVRRLTREVRERLETKTREFRDMADPVRVVATSKTFKQLARLTGAPKTKAGPYVRRTLHRNDLREQIPRLATMKNKHRAEQKGISKPRAPQILAGAIVAEAAMRALGIEHADICPWALREGIIARRMQTMPGFAITDDLLPLVQTSIKPPMQVTAVPDPL